MKCLGWMALLSLLAACSSTAPVHAPTFPSRDEAPINKAVTASPVSETESPNPVPKFVWPLQEMKVINFYGWRKRRLHDGVDLRARVGTPIFAAASGEVIHSGKGLKGYGRMIVIDHGHGWSTVYAHLSKCDVKNGTHVSSGEQLGLSGKTGRAKGPHLHFEVRKGSDPLDPLLFLPAVR